ncbi:MAG TPA: hypothetical protein PKM97_05535 [Bacteroidia bacterium]|nr:hypothetical protein [Bacteroidia bacterium]
MSDPIAQKKELLLKWCNENFDLERIKVEMDILGFDSEKIKEYQEDYKKILRSKRQAIGFALLVIGAITGFVSCVLTLTNLFPGLFYWILYGLTSVALLIILIGLYFVFE